MSRIPWNTVEAARRLLNDESGTIRKEAPQRIALLYPSPYRTAMSSLGYQEIYRTLNGLTDLAADRAMRPEQPGPWLTMERELPVGDYPLLAFSVAYELEIAGVIDCLERAGIPPLAADRGAEHPLVIAGGPLTFSNPAPLGPFCDVILLGEGEQLASELVQLSSAAGFDKDRTLAAVRHRPGYYLPAEHGDQVGPIAQADDHCLPARAQIITPNTELSNMFLTEVARGCSRGCTYCVMRRSTNGGMRIVPADAVLAGIPSHARRVGLVGAAVTDHPRLPEILRALTTRGCEIGISSLRADRLTDELVGLLRAGGYRTLTVALDGASERLRATIERRHTERHLLRAAELARAHRLSTLKIYMMLGLPDESDDDIDELVRFTGELRKIHPRIAFGLAPFVAKRNTPLDGAPFAGIATVDARLRRLRAGLRGAAKVRPVSARWAWVEYMLAQCGQAAGLATLAAHRAGGSFGAYKRAFAEHGCEPAPAGPSIPTTPQLIALRRQPPPS